MSSLERIALFIDGANLYASAKALGFDIDYKRLLKEFQGKGRLIRAFYYTALVDDQEYSSVRPLVDWLDYNGYSVVTKPTKEFVDSIRFASNPPPSVTMCRPLIQTTLSANSRVDPEFLDPRNNGLPGSATPSPLFSVGTSG